MDHQNAPERGWRFLALLLPLISLFSLSTLPASARADGVIINEIMAANAASHLDETFGNFSDWFELYNTDIHSLDLSGYTLTDDLTKPAKWPIPEGIVIEGGSSLVFWADDANQDNHTNFQLEQSGETLGLFTPTGELVDSVTFGPQVTDVSYGRILGGSDVWLYYAVPTPNDINNTNGLFEATQAPPPTFSLSGGMLQSPQELRIFTETTGGIIRFTTDGTLPTPNDLDASILYDTPLTINTSTIIRARVFSEEFLPSRTVTRSFLFADGFDLPIISLVTNPGYLWTDEMGIYVFGPSTPPDSSGDGSGETTADEGEDEEEEEDTLGDMICRDMPFNYNKKWERPAHLEFYQNNQLEFKLDAGIKIFGGCSRSFPQKSLAVKVREKYSGSATLDYPLFLNNTNQYTSFVLRNSGGDWFSTMFRDAMMQSLLDGRMDMDKQAYRPAVLFLNGEFWGIHNIREKLDENYLATHHGIDPENVDILEGDGLAIAGETDHYEEMVEKLSQMDLAEPESFVYADSVVDLDEFTNYLMAQIYYSNGDWPDHNIKFWRSREEGEKWRWLLYDTDTGFGLMDSESYSVDTLQAATSTEDDSNIEWSTFLARKLLENSSFKDHFRQAFAMHLNQTFDIDRVIGVIDEFQLNLQRDMVAHLDKWTAISTSEDPIVDWMDNVEVMREFARNRPEYMWTHISDRFSEDGKIDVTLDTSGEGRGRLLVEDIEVIDLPFTGTFFADVTLEVAAIPEEGSQFVGWEEREEEDNPLRLGYSENLTLTAQFDELAPIVIREIHYNPSSSQGDDSDYEFIELINIGLTPIDLTDYAFSEGIEMTFPDGSVIDTQEIIVVARNAETYQDQGYQVFEWEKGKLSNSGETLTLINAEGNEVDQVTYSDTLPWTPSADGGGGSLALINPALDNAAPENWWVGPTFGGTPGSDSVL
ncbi:MAG: CotH kinase family protein [Magnetococcales bacterium]|nr:CotH kinase family protein [Magnetococcales bacterium]